MSCLSVIGQTGAKSPKCNLLALLFQTRTSCLCLLHLGTQISVQAVAQFMWLVPKRAQPAVLLCPVQSLETNRAIFASLHAMPCQPFAQALDLCAELWQRSRA